MPLAQDDYARLYDVILTMKTREEVSALLSDLCTPAEIRAFAERLKVAVLLDDGVMSYREIAVAADASTTTVTRVARFLKEMPYRGYRIALDRLKDLK